MSISHTFVPDKPGFLGLPAFMTIPNWENLRDARNDRKLAFLLMLPSIVYQQNLLGLWLNAN